MHERRELLTVIGELLSSVISRYRQLAERGQVELSVTPYAHPILPLLLDFQSAQDAMPDAPLPLLQQYPGGAAQARWHIREGIETFRRHFGFAPAGCWPSEGAVSTASLKLLTEAGFRWAASGEGVLRNSLHRSGHADHSVKEAWLYRRYSVADSGMNCFFRDDGLSDLIGFSYATWHADDAVNNLVHNLENIAHCCRAHPEHVVSIIMDGENAWEHYPENAYHFLHALYRRLSEHPKLELTTFSDCLKTVPAKSLRVLAGRFLGIRNPVHLDRRAGQKPRLGHAGRCQARLRCARPVDSMPRSLIGPGDSSPCVRARTGSGGSVATTRWRRWPISSGFTACI